MENRINRPPSGNFGVDSLGGSSRKRKSMAPNQPGAFSDSNLQYYSQRESNLQNSNFHSGPHVEDNTRGLCSNQAKSMEPAAWGHQKDQFPAQTVHPGSWINGNGNLSLHGNRTENIFNTSSHVYPQPSEYKGPFDSLNMQASVGRSWPTKVVQSEVYQSLPFVKSDGEHTRRNQVACSFQEIENKSGVPSEFRQSIGFSNSGGINHFPSVEAASLGSSSLLEQIQNPTFSQDVVQVSSSGTSGVTLGSISANGEQVQGEGFVKIKKIEKASDMKNLMHPLPESSSKICCPTSTVESGQTADQTCGHPVLDEKSKLQFGKSASTVSERLWDGSVRLSSTVDVSAVAFFKSGEKLLDTNWSESVEVKGKVRLDAFEKYIQDLPRSRNRGLMVISLCWKEGSSEAGLAGMKEVAKGYKKAEKVGRAPISPGIDLYICPRCDAIITILAKHGFFKGMAAVEDKPDSMIGCVVWRKNQTSSNSVANKPESKSNRLSEKPLNSTSLSPLPQAVETEKKLPVAQPAQECAERTDSERQKQTETNNSVAVPEQPKTSLELQKPIMPFSSDKESTTFLDDDDLPEFDFRTACGISQTSATKPPESVLLDSRLPAEENRKTDRSVLPVTPNLPPLPVSGQRSDRSKFPSTTNEGTRSSKLIGDPRLQIPVLTNMGEISSVQNKLPTTPGSATVFPHPKNVFDDDDDMPEWCPPERRSLAETINRSTTFPSELRNPSFQNFARGHPQPVPFSPPQNAMCPPFLSQGFPPEAPQPRQHSSMWSYSDSILGPAPSFDTKVPSYPAEKRGRRRR